jgi:hypothetical protein
VLAPAKVLLHSRSASPVAEVASDLWYQRLNDSAGVGTNLVDEAGFTDFGGKLFKKNANAGSFQGSTKMFLFFL